MKITLAPRWASSTLSLSGNQYLACYESSVLSSLTSVTAEAWVRVSNLTGVQVIVGNADGAGGGQFLLYLNNGVPNAYVGIDPYTINGPKPITVNAWHHLASTYDNSTKTLTLYVDGRRVAQKTFSGTLSTASVNTLIGAGIQNGVNSWYLQGDIGRIMIWNVARTHAEVLKDSVRVSAYKAVENVNLIFHVDFSLLPWTDSSGNQVSWSQQNSPGYSIDIPALVLTGNAYANCGSDPEYSIPGNAPYTLEGWFLPSETSNGTLLSYGTASGWEYQVLYINNSVQARRNSDGLQLWSYTLILPGSYYHFAVSYDSKTRALALYINGNLQSVQYFPSAVTAVPDGSVLIGAQWDSTGAPANFFNGSIQNIRIWDTCLTQAEIAQWMYNDVVDDDRLISNYDFTVNPPVDDTDHTEITLVNGASVAVQKVQMEDNTFYLNTGFPLSVNASYLTMEKMAVPMPPSNLVVAPQPDFFSKAHKEESWARIRQLYGIADDKEALSAFEASYEEARQMIKSRPELSRVTTRTDENGMTRIVYHGVLEDMLMYEGPTGAITDCQIWWMSFCFTITVGLLQAIGIVPTLGQARDRITNYLTNNPAVRQGIITLLSDKITVASALLIWKIIYDQGLLWPILKIILSSLGYYSIFWVAKEIVAYCTGWAAAERIGSFISWAVELGVLAKQYQGKCPEVQVKRQPALA